MELLKNNLITKARRTHGIITPCSGKNSLRDCFTIEDDVLLFWYNCKSGSTHLLIENI